MTSIFQDFAVRLDVLTDREVDEMTAGLVTGLKSW